MSRQFLYAAAVMATMFAVGCTGETDDPSAPAEHGGPANQPADEPADTAAGATPSEQPDASDTEMVEIQEEWSGVNGSIVEPRHEVVRDADTWRDLWGDLHANQSPIPDPPAVDFDQHMVLAVFMGQRNTGGYSVRITSVAEVPDGIKAVYREKSPGADALVTQALTAPYHLVAVPKSSKNVQFVADAAPPVNRDK